MTDERDLKQKIDGINRIRINLGLMPVIITTRICLLCEVEFKSEGLNNRMCPKCRVKRDGLKW